MGQNYELLHKQLQVSLGALYLELLSSLLNLVGGCGCVPPMRPFIRIQVLFKDVSLIKPTSSRPRSAGMSCVLHKDRNGDFIADLVSSFAFLR